MPTFDPDILMYYSTYCELKDKRKSVLSSPIGMWVKTNNNNFKVGNSLAVHETISDQVRMDVEVRCNNFKHFKFRVICPTIFKKPFFRFDSSGPAHRNNDPEIPLKDQMKETPHFHMFNPAGYEIAYHTQALLNPAQAQKLEDINICIMHFCEECNIRLNATDYPEVNLHPEELPLNFTSDDPLSNVAF